MPSFKPSADSKSPPSPAKSTRSTASTYRRPSSTRYNPSSRLNHLFGQPSVPLPPTVSDSHSTSTSPSPGFLGGSSEEALARQLDRDAGGERMGLRSRRSSSATIQTLRNAGRQASEEVLAEEPEAGPSRLPTSPLPPDMEILRDEHLDIKGKGKGRETVRPPQVNPKKSMTWQRWNQSTTFPKASVANPATFETPPAVPALETPAVVATETEPPDPRSAAPMVENTAVKASLVSTATPSPASAAAAQIPGPVKSQSKTWWSRGKHVVKGTGETSMPPVAVDMEGLNATTPEPMLPAAETVAAKPVQEPAPPPPPPTVAPTPSESPSALSQQASSPSQPQRRSSASSQQSQQQRKAKVTAPEQTASGGSRWYSYLGFSAGGNPAVKQLHDDQVEDPTSEKAAEQVSSAETVLAAIEVPAMATANAPDEPMVVDSGAIDAKPSSPVTSIAGGQEALEGEADSPQQDAAGTTSFKSNNKWGGYIYSLVIPQLGEGSSSRPGSIRSTKAPSVDSPAVRVDPAVEQAPAPVSATRIEPPSEVAPATELAVTPQPDTELQTDVAPSVAAPPAPPAATWLTYLTSRAAQKTISNGPSLTSSRKGRTGSDVTEEVMDLSNDADFPCATPQPTTSPSITKADARKKRLSITSKASSAGGGRPSLDDATRSVSAANGSATPAVTVAQPNFVIPTFETTFNRPPRSLQPVGHAPQAPALSPTSGLTASAAGIAWKAWGTASSYVYGGATGQTAPLVEDEKEMRGKKEGRDIGGDLPRPLREESGKESWRTIKRVVVFGVHGWFPAKMLNSLIGEPTGTSTKFANMMAQAVRTFLAERGVTDIRLTIIPLEGEGTIESRVDRLYKAYLSSPSYINDTRRADAIFFAAHSQGCIVTTHLISRLIAQGHIRTANNADAVARCEWAFGPVGIMPPDPRRSKSGLLGVEEEGDGRQRVCLLAMCGVHLGPFYSLNSSNVIQPYLQWFENNAARELFEFQDTLSPVSQAYHKALAMILDNEVKVLLLSSLNDQVVPIYSSSFSTATHPLLLRALYVDGASHSTSDFMTKLITFALMLRNAGIDDEGLVGHLSEATAGGLTGIGHSTPYESSACYDLAVSYLLCSGPPRQPLPPLEVESFTARDAKNDFELPWILRALTDAPAVKDLFPEELSDLKQGVISWRPVTKALKDIKKRLEPMAGKQSRLRTLNHSASSASLASSGGKEHLGSSPSGGKLVAGLKRDW